MQAAIRNILFTAECGLLKGKRQADAYVVTATGAATLCTAAECTSENTAEDVSEIAKVSKAAESTAAIAAARSGVKGGVTELVIFRLLLGIRENGIGLVDLLEALFGLGVARMEVGMIFFGKLAVGPLDGIGIGALIEAEYLIVVSLRPMMILSSCENRFAGKGFPVKVHPFPRYFIEDY